VGDEVVSMLVVGAVWRSSSSGLTSHLRWSVPCLLLPQLSRRLLSGLVGGHPGWVVLCGLCPCCIGFSPVFR
jgi:hypothetical protein